MTSLVGVLGGTFDPIHFGHLRPALDVLELCGLDEIRFIPNKVPPHRQQPLLTANERAALVQQAIADNPAFALDQRELKRDGPSYMVDTLQELRQEDPRRTLCLILGMDAYSGISHWHQWQAILELCHLIVTSRPGAELPQFGQQQPFFDIRYVDDASVLRQASSGKILLQSVTQLDISASLIRQCLRQGRSVQYLVPETVREIIETKYAT